MAHFTKSALTPRGESTNPEWLPICAQISEVVNLWAGRGDLAVYAGEDAAYGTIACFIQNKAEIEINTTNAFGLYATPRLVGDLRQRDVQFDWAQPVGVIYHEALHAKFSEWNIDTLKAMSEPQYEVFALLDESRIERLGVIQMPENQIFLRSSALHLALEGVEENLDSLTNIRAAAYVSALSLARVDAGVLRLSDVRSTYNQVVSVLGEELFEKFRSIWVEFQKLSNTQILRGAELAQAWVDLLKEADPEGEPKEADYGEGEGDPSEGEGKDKGKGSITKWVEALSDDKSESDTQIASVMADQQSKEESKKESDKRSAQTKDKNESRQQAEKIFSNSSGAGESGSSSRLTEKRKPTGQERAAAVKLAQMLEQAKYRERSVTEVRSREPKGRLKTRIAVQNAALKSKGVIDLAPEWRQTKRKHTDDPTLTIGVLVDISGSMAHAMNAMATTAWVMSEAGRRVQAKTAMVYFGSGVFPTLKVGQHLDEVNVYSAPDGTEKFDQAFKAIDGALDLTYGSGVRMLVVVSDGCFTENERVNAVAAIEKCKRNGVAVLWITPKGCSTGYDKRIVGTNGVVAEQMVVDEIAMTIGRAATESLAKASVGG